MKAEGLVKAMRQKLEKETPNPTERCKRVQLLLNKDAKHMDYASGGTLSSERYDPNAMIKDVAKKDVKFGWRITITDYFGGRGE